MTTPRTPHPRPLVQVEGKRGEDWRDRALCAQVAGDVMYPEKGGHGDAAAAKRLCNGDPKRGIEPCPVKAECLTEALTTEAGRYGVWGGMTPTERRRMGGAA